MKTAADVVRDHANMEHRKRVRAAVDEIYRAYPDLKRTDATSNLIERLCNEYAGEPVVPELWLFQEMARANPKLVREQLQGVTIPVDAQRNALINEIAQLLRSPNGDGCGGRYDDFSLQNEKRRMSSWSKEALEQRLNQVRLAQRLQTHTAAEIREGLKVLRAEERREPVLPAEWTKERLMDKSTSSHALKFLIRKYGAKVVNDRLMGRG
jgi:hypothetical protein